MKFFPKPPKILEKKDNWARFSIEALYPGYGITIGNSLRRVLLSSLSGSAITQVKIKGVSHEFSTIPGVLEDVISIMMNLRQMRFRMYGDDSQKAVLRVKGLPSGKREREIIGSDFDLPSQLELVNGSCHIATLTDKKAELEIEILVERGVGYQSSEQFKKRKKPEVGSLPIDAIFTPIRKVNYKIENMRVGDRTDFDKLYLEITTDGTITPSEAFYRVSDILVKHFEIFSESLEPTVDKEKLKKGVEKKKELKKTKGSDKKLKKEKEKTEKIEKKAKTKKRKK